jgi:hypothetical protein
MIKPPDIEDDNWEILVAAAGGDASAVRRLLDGHPTPPRAGTTKLDRLRQRCDQLRDRYDGPYSPERFPTIPVKKK